MSMLEEKPVVENAPVTETEQGTPPVKSQEEVELEAKKAALEEEVRGLEGTVDSLKEDIVRKRQERKADDGDQQPVVDKEALLAELEARQREILTAELKP